MESFGTGMGADEAEHPYGIRRGWIVLEDLSQSGQIAAANRRNDRLDGWI